VERKVSSSIQPLYPRLSIKGNRILIYTIAVIIIAAIVASSAVDDGGDTGVEFRSKG